MEIKCNTRVGRDISFDKIKKDFDYVYMAPGAHRSQKLGLAGEDMPGVYGGVEFLRDFNAHEEAWLNGKKTLGARVAVIGGGNSAIDAARVALRLGSDVTILYRRERKDMPAAEEEIIAAEHEGIKIEYLVAPLKLEAKDGKLSGITCERMKLGEFDRSGRRKPVAIAGSAFTLSVDAIIAAIGQVPDLSFVPRESGISVNRWDTFDLDGNSKSRTTNAKFYAGGDAVTGPDTVIGAIEAGHQAAREMDAAIRAANGESAYEEPAEEAIEIPLIIDEETKEEPQVPMPELAAAMRKTSFVEVELGFTPEEAAKEACWCLRCDAEI